MNFITVAFSNIRRNPVRSILTGLSLIVSAVTVTVVLSLDKGYSRAVTDELVNKTGVHMYVTKEGCPIEAASVIAQGGLSPLYVSEDILSKIEGMPQIDVIMPFKLFAVTTSDGLRTDIFMGITDAIQKMKPDWQFEKGGWFTSDSSVILGAEMARIENLSVGEKIYTEHFQREFVISGILKRNYSQDDGTFFLPLKTSQELVGRAGKLSAIALKLKDISTLDASKNILRSMMPSDYFVIGSKELGDGILQFFSSTRMIMFVMVGVALLISVFGIINTMLMAVLERRKEIAYLKCVGASGSDLIKLISLETLMICLGGSITGTALGALVSPSFGNMMRKFIVAYLPTGNIAQVDWTICLFAFGTCTIIGLVCSLYPAFRASKIVPMEVLRNE